MTQKYTGMRKGISLVEMVIAIVLFAALAAIGLKYAKSYLNTDLQAKKARTAALTDQANQLVQAYTIYRNETGLDPSSITELNGTSGILNAIPTVITEISTTGWELNTSTGMEGTGVAFQVRIDLNGTTTPTNSDEQYCAIFNREFNTSTELNVTDQQTFGGADINATRAMYGNFFCYSRSTGDNWIMIVVP